MGSVNGTHKNSRIASAFATVLFFASAVTIGFGFDWDGIFKLLVQMDLLMFVLSTGALTLVHFRLRSQRWLLMLGEEGSRLPRFDIYVATAFGTGLALVTPAQTGDALRIERLKSSHNLDRSLGYATLLAEKLLDIAFVLGLGVVLGFLCWCLL